jgi:hypothetical protein
VRERGAKGVEWYASVASGCVECDVYDVIVGAEGGRRKRQTGSGDS